MSTVTRRDELLEQIRALSFEDREYIEAELLRDAYESGRQSESPEFLAEIKQRARDSLSSQHPGYSLDEAVASATAAVEAVRARNR